MVNGTKGRASRNWRILATILFKVYAPARSTASREHPARFSLNRQLHLKISRGLARFRSQLWLERQALVCLLERFGIIPQLGIDREEALLHPAFRHSMVDRVEAGLP